MILLTVEVLNQNLEGHRYRKLMGSVKKYFNHLKTVVRDNQTITISTLKPNKFNLGKIITYILYI